MIETDTASPEKITVEICCGSYYDALEAAAGGAERIELNSALALGGLTPSLGELLLVKRDTSLQVIAMARPRGAGFCYGDEEFEQMLLDARLLMEHGADGIAFGCLKDDGSIDLRRTEQLIEVVRKLGGQAVFHRAFDCVTKPYQALEQLAALGVNRILTSGLKEKAPDGWETIKALRKRAGNKLEILAGSGIHAANAKELLRQTGITQLHSSCKDWRTDPTTEGNGVSYSFGAAPHGMCFDTVSREQVKRLIHAVR